MTQDGAISMDVAGIHIIIIINATGIILFTLLLILLLGKLKLPGLVMT